MNDQHPQQQYTQSQPGYEGQPPPGYYQQGPPPKKKHTLRNVLLVVVLILVLLVGGCIALIGGVANEVDKAIEEEQANDQPRAVAEGKAFTHDGFEVDGGWQVTEERFGGATIEGLRVTNTADESRTALLSFRFYDGKENLGEVECTSNQLQSGESSVMDCVSFDSEFPNGYKEIKVSDSW